MAGAITLYDAYFPTFLKSVDSLESIFRKAEAHAKENGIDANAEYAPARLHEDMKPLTFQVWVVCRVLRLSAVILKVGGFEADEPKEPETFEEFFDLLARARESLRAVKPEQVNGREREEIELNINNRSIKSTVIDAFNGWLVTNLFFHITTAYGILRMKGVPLGKNDYLLPFHS